MQLARPLVLAWGLMGSWLALAVPSNHSQLLNRADSLNHAGHTVQALSIYEHLLHESLSGCHAARAHAGVAGIQWNVGNSADARPHLLIAAERCSICPTSIRTQLSLDVVSWMVSCGMTSEALELLAAEHRLGPAPGKEADVDLARAELLFVEGQWQACIDATSNLDGPRPEGLRLQAGAMKGLPLDSLPWLTYIQSTKPSMRVSVMAELTHLHTMLGAAGRHVESLTLARSMVGLYDPVADPEAWTLSQLRVAISAERAGKPLEALLAFHDAGRTANQLENIQLRARIAREQARFERDRGATNSALQHLQKADSLTVLMLQGALVGRETKQFAPQPMIVGDPFDVAASQAMASPCTPGAWPFACALILLGLIAAGLRAHELKKALRQERMRALRIQRMSMHEADPFATGAAETVGSFAVHGGGEVQEVLARADRLDFEDIIASLEMDHGTIVEWNLEGEPEGQVAPEGLLSLLSVTVKRLLEGHNPDESYAGHIRNDWHGIVVEIEGPENPATLELERMFAGGTHSPRWNPVLVQIEKLAGRLTVEKRSSGLLSLTFMLPHIKR
ncbi:MAG: hypothetical protein O3B70_01425 [Bacteroidetes bacterium]|nr:hypothetical protein [Bacteroidota bacterium]MDA0902970.1 hypothetical protein [Bacteroidota bacterium]MDA1241614.1 hypothetical protein [Bacteroidota bacterium]